ncbi:hypothetical protein [Cryptosporangium aurantiacum]|uniref:RibD C-terminal domain-containing protein n=1 Tax=Cryptosporangium aurantiacum TaxID=134849 RepID=A0A1M7RK03_9ACTN|nr:hypothetical protein [Cryptosporangium aurantiacum]SHN46637.1 hypothetical protein SAMN05443668_11720 [Cryptosporangium aurantiacum]
MAVHPVVLGGGRPLFADTAERLSLQVVGSRVLDGRVVVTQYV